MRAALEAWSSAIDAAQDCLRDEIRSHIGHKSETAAGAKIMASRIDETGTT
jgi:hypothetical protein